MQQPIIVKVVGGVPAENPAEVVGNAAVGRPGLCTVSTQTKSINGESDFEQDRDFHLHDLEQDGDPFQLDLIPYSGLRCRRLFNTSNTQYVLSGYIKHFCLFIRLLFYYRYSSS